MVRVVRNENEIRKDLAKRIDYIRKIKPEFDKFLRKVAQDNFGRSIIVPLKEEEKIIEKAKLDYHGDIYAVKDILRGSIVVPNKSRIDSVIFDLKKYFEIISMKDRFENPKEDKYRDLIIHLKLKDEICEIQVHLEELLKIKDYVSHFLYDIRKRINLQTSKEKRTFLSWEDRLIKKIIKLEEYANEQAYLRQNSRDLGENNDDIIFFVSSNHKKYEEFKKLLPNLKWIKIDLPEIESKSHNDTIRKKLDSALDYIDGVVMVEDVGLYCDGLISLPGPIGIPQPFRRYYKGTVTPKKFAELVISTKNQNAKMVSTIGLSEGSRVSLFEGVVEGKIVLPRGHSGHEWDNIFQPNGSTKTFGEMTPIEKEKVSMRTISSNKLFKYLKNKNKID